MGFGSIVGSALGAATGLAGGLISNASQNQLAQQNYQAQKEFAQNGIRWKVADAKAAGLKVTHRALNDKSVEGFVHESLPVMGVQFNPEAAPGADDTMYIFDQFIEMLSK